MLISILPADCLMKTAFHLRATRGAPSGISERAVLGQNTGLPEQARGIACHKRCPNMPAYNPRFFHSAMVGPVWFIV